MRSNVRTAIVLSTCAVILTFASASFAQMVGGYKAVAKTDAGAVAAADFAIEAQSEKTEKEYTLEDIVKAERQVVQGSNYRLCLKVSADGSDTFYVLAVVYVDLKNNRKLSSFVLSTCGETAVAPVSKLPVVGGFGAAAKLTLRWSPRQISLWPRDPRQWQVHLLWTISLVPNARSFRV
ncbi:MAG: hypothetical protein IPI76_06780 [Chloracidobacterium sp.]|nr:hypothetical protein [Chloracidobacterium sp.]